MPLGNVESPLDLHVSRLKEETIMPRGELHQHIDII